jgi:serine/threonine-protein kinase
MPGENSELNGRYRLIKKIGQGGFAQVFLATDSVLNRAVAIKVLHLEFSNNPEILERFRREAQTVAALNHPNILPVFDYGELSAIRLIW